MTQLTPTATSKSPFASKTLWGLVATAAAAYLPVVCTALGVDPHSTPIIGTIHGVGIPAGLILAAIGRVTAKYKLF